MMFLELLRNRVEMGLFSSTVVYTDCPCLFVFSYLNPISIIICLARSNASICLLALQCRSIVR